MRASKTKLKPTKPKPKGSQRKPRARKRRNVRAAKARRFPKEVRGFKTMREMIDDCTLLSKNAHKQAALLERAGWTRGETRAIDEMLLQVFAEDGKVTLRRRANLEATRAFRRLVKDTLHFRERLCAALKVVELTEPDVLDSPSFRRWRTSRPARLVLWLAGIHDVVKEHRVQLKQLLGQDAEAALQDYRDRLSREFGAQRHRVASRSTITADKKKLMNELALRVMRLRRIARVVFAGDKLMLRKLRRSASGRKPAKAADVAVEKPPAKLPNAPETE